MAETLYRMQVDPESMRQALASVEGVRDGATIVLMRSINRTTRGVRIDMVDGAYQRLNLTKKVIREGTTTTRGRKGKHRGISISKASKKRLSGSAYSTGEPVPFVDGNTKRPLFGARQTKAGVTAQVYRNGGRVLLKHGFLATMRSGHKAAFWRVKPGEKRVARLPIAELFGPRVEDVLARSDVFGPVESKAQVRFDKAMAHEIDYLLKQNQPQSGDGAE